jgi:hypothetical protein
VTLTDRKVDKKLDLKLKPDAAKKTLQGAAAATLSLDDLLIAPAIQIQNTSNLNPDYVPSVLIGLPATVYAVSESLADNSLNADDLKTKTKDVGFTIDKTKKDAQDIGFIYFAKGTYDKDALLSKEKPVCAVMATIGDKPVAVATIVDNKKVTTVAQQTFDVVKDVAAATKLTAWVDCTTKDSKLLDGKTKKAMTVVIIERTMIPGGITIK